jgi:hypothetical protein
MTYCNIIYRHYFHNIYFHLMFYVLCCTYLDDRCNARALSFLAKKRKGFTTLCGNRQYLATGVSSVPVTTAQDLTTVEAVSSLL